MSIALAGPCAELLHREIPCVTPNVQQFTVNWAQAWKATRFVWKEETWRLNQLSQWIHSALAIIPDGLLDFYTPIVALLLERGKITGVEVQAAWDQLKATEEANSS